MEEAIEVTAEVIEPTDKLQVTYTPAVFNDNLAALDAYVDQQIAPYVGVQIDPKDYDQIKEARKCMADLNKLKDPIETERKRIKREYEGPLKAFEGRVKGITSKIDSTREKIKDQVDQAVEAFKERRKDILREEYERCAGVIADVIPFDALLDPEWLNHSTNEVKAKNQLADKMESALKGYNTLQAKTLNHKDQVVKHYAETLDLIAALELEDKLNEEDRKMAEFKAAQEAARMTAAERREPEPEPEPIKEPVQPAQQATTATEPVFKWALNMEFTGTREFATQVASTLKGMGLSGASIVCKEAISND